MSPDELTREVRKIRGFGWVVCDWRGRGRRAVSPVDEIEAYLAAVDLEARCGRGTESSERGGWREINTQAAKETVVHWMRHNLAYGLVAKKSGEEQAAKAAEYFFSRFKGPLTLYTNTGEPGPGGYWDSSSWTPKTQHTFDRGVVAMSEELIGLIWFADED